MSEKMYVVTGAGLDPLIAADENAIWKSLDDQYGGNCRYKYTADNDAVFIGWIDSAGIELELKAIKSEVYR